MLDSIYADTSVIGGYFDAEFEVDTKLFFDRILAKEFKVHISEITMLELSPAPDRVRQLLEIIPKECLITIEFTEEAKTLAGHYIDEKILGSASLNDAYHIAIATIHRIDVVVSWNFKHIVNLDKIRLFNAVNRKYGYPAIDIRSPKELIKYE